MIISPEAFDGACRRLVTPRFSEAGPGPMAAGIRVRLAYSRPQNQDGA